MASVNRTKLYCSDPHKTFSDDVSRRFSDTGRYEVKVFNNGDELLASFEEEMDKRSCKIAILGLADAKEAPEAEELVLKLRTVLPGTGVIIVVNPENIEEVKKLFRFSVEAYIPLNVNSILRIHNAVKKHISEFNISVYLRKRNLSLMALAAFTVIVISFLIFSWFRFPGYF